MSLIETDITPIALIARARHRAGHGNVGRRRLSAQVQHPLFAAAWRNSGRGLMASWSLVIACLVAASAITTDSLKEALGIAEIAGNAQSVFLFLAAIIAIGSWELTYREAAASLRIKRAIEFTGTALILALLASHLGFIGA